jgi:hypothetical protein
MAQTAPPTITASPTAPNRSDRSTFSTRVDNFVTWLIAAVAQFGALGTNVYNNAVDCYNNAVAAAASAASALAATGVTVWVSGTTYAVGNARFSPINFLTYRRKTAGAGTTDPSTDTTNWQVIGGAQAGANIDITSLGGLTTPLSVAQGGTGQIAKDTTGGYPGLTLFKLNLRNAANTFTNFLTNATTAARTWTMPDKDGTVAMTSDLFSAGSYYNFTSSRFANITYPNSTGRAMYVQFTGSMSTSLTICTIVIDGVAIGYTSESPSSAGIAYASFIVPSGSTYLLAPNVGTMTVAMWFEFY